MSIDVITPGLSCICGVSEIDEAKAQGFKEIYMLSLNGIFKRHYLRGEDRYIQVKVDSIPGRAKPVEMQESFSKFLPAGKVPMELYNQIEAFFRKVSELKSANLEAMIFILWNPEQGYHLFVPSQSVSAASVRFDPSEIPTGSTIVIDVHSHNSMGAFFSGTDDNNDKDTIRFSGVFGKLDTATAATIWRFNYFTKKFPVKVSDMFDTTPSQVAVPQEWLDKVEVPRYSPPAYLGNQGGNSNLGNVGRGRNTDHLKPYQYQKTNSTSSPVVNPNPSPNGGVDNSGRVFVEPAFRDAFQGFGMDEGFEHDEFYASIRRDRDTERNRAPVNHVAPVHKVDTKPTNDFPGTAQAGVKWGYDPSRPIVGGIGPNSNVPALTKVAKPVSAVVTLTDETPKTVVAHGSIVGNKDEEWNLTQVVEDVLVDKEVGAYQMGKPQLLPMDLGEDNGESSHFHDQALSFTEEQYALIQMEHGVAVADAWRRCDANMHHLSEIDDLLNGLAADMFGLMTEDGKGKFFKDILGNLPESVIENLQTNGI